MLRTVPFKTREELKKVPMMGPKTFEQCAGFLRIPGAGQSTGSTHRYHPESYFVVEQMAKDLQASLEDLIKQG